VEGKTIMIWSKLRKRIRGFITPELHDRIDLHLTGYREAHDAEGEVWITLDGNKICGGGYYHWYTSPLPVDSEQDFYIEYGIHRDFFRARITSEKVAEIMNSGIHSTSHITVSLENYLQEPFELDSWTLD
jgi:hypothetical protein